MVTVSFGGGSKVHVRLRVQYNPSHRGASVHVIFEESERSRGGAVSNGPGSRWGRCKVSEAEGIRSRARGGQKLADQFVCAWLCAKLLLIYNLI